MSDYAHLRDHRVTKTECLAVTRALSRHSTVMGPLALFHDRVNLVGRVRSIALDLLEEGYIDRNAITRMAAGRVRQDASVFPITGQLVAAMQLQLCREVVHILWERWFPSSPKVE
jgi:hypothetical protein